MIKIIRYKSAGNSIAAYICNDVCYTKIVKRKYSTLFTEYISTYKVKYWGSHLTEWYLTTSGYQFQPIGYLEVKKIIKDRNNKKQFERKFKKVLDI